MPKQAADRAERARENWFHQGGRPQRRTAPELDQETDSIKGPGKRAEEKILSVPLDEILPDRYQGRLRWAIDITDLEKLYSGQWDAQDLLSAIHEIRASESNHALDEAWQVTLDLAHSILAEGQVAPITIYPERSLPSGYRYLIETGEGRYWAYQLMRWISTNDPDALAVAPDDWKEDPHYIRAVAIPSPSRLRQVAENEQRQSYPSAVDRAIAYASMLAEDAGYEVSGSPPGINRGQLQIPDAYRRAALRGLRGKQSVIQQLPASARQIQRHLKLLTDLDPYVLAGAKQNGLTEAQLRPLVGQSAENQRALIVRVIADRLSSRDVDALSRGEDEAVEEIFLEPEPPDPAGRATPSTLEEEIARLLRALTRAASRYEQLRDRATDAQLAAYLDVHLRSFEDVARGSKRAGTPRRRIQRLMAFLQKIE